MDAAVETVGLLDKLLNGGPVGVLACGLGLALKIVWRRTTDLQQKLDAVQEARIAERDKMVVALTDSNRLAAEMLELLK